MVILADQELRELGVIKDSNITVDLNGDRTFSVQIARSNWREELTFSSLIYIMGTEYGGIIGEILTDTTLDYVEAKGLSWRGRLAKKIIEPPVGSDYKTVSGELHTVMKELIEPEFDGLFVVSQEDTGVTVSNYQFDRYCTLYDGIVKMLKSKGYRLQLSFRREQNELGYLYIEAVPIVDYSNRVELSKDCKLNYTMDDKRNGVNHLIVTGKGELQDRNILHLYVQENGEIGTKKHYTGLQEIAEVYENTSTETDELMSAAEDRLRSLAGKKTFKMDVAKLGIDVGIGDIVGGRDYLTGLYMAKPVGNIVYEIINDVNWKETVKNENNDRKSRNTTCYRAAVSTVRGGHCGAGKLYFDKRGSLRAGTCIEQQPQNPKRNYESPR